MGFSLESEVVKLLGIEAENEDNTPELRPEPDIELGIEDDRKKEELEPIINNAWLRDDGEESREEPKFPESQSRFCEACNSLHVGYLNGFARGIPVNGYCIRSIGIT